MKKIITPLFTVCALLLTSLASAQTSDEIIAKHIEAVGGKDNWQKVKSMRMECTMKAQGAELKTTIVQVNKKAMRQDISVMGMTGWSIMTTTEGWSYMPFTGQTKAEPLTADDVKNAQDGLDITDEFITYKELGKKLEYLGKDDVDGTECYKFKMTSKEGKESTFYLDPETYYLVKGTKKFKADGKEMEESTLFSNFKKLPEGIVLPMTIGSSFGQGEVTKIEINPKIDESIFKPAK